jgi:hypothetical protein
MKKSSHRVAWIAGLSALAVGVVGGAVYLTGKSAQSGGGGGGGTPMPTGSWSKLTVGSDGSVMLSQNANFAISDPASDAGGSGLIVAAVTIAQSQGLLSNVSYSQPGAAAPSGFPNDGQGTGALRVTGSTGGKSVALTVGPQASVWIEAV